jgi:hypothetical protein
MSIAGEITDHDPDGLALKEWGLRRRVGRSQKYREKGQQRFFQEILLVI